MDKYCQHCRQQNAPDALFCTECASPLSLIQTGGQVVFKSGWTAIAAYAVMGTFCSLALLVLPLTILLQTREFRQFDLLLLVISILPLMPAGYFFSTQISRLLKTSIALDDFGLRLNVPVWAYNYWKSGQEVRLGWNEVERITYDICYTIRAMPVYGYEIYTSRSTYALTNQLGVDAEKIANMIAARAGKTLEYIIPKPTDVAVAKAKKWVCLLLFIVAAYSVTVLYLLITYDVK